MSMQLSLVCPPCGHVISADSENELVEVTAAHAKSKHGVTLAREEILKCAQPAAAAPQRPVDPSRRIHHVPVGGGPCIADARQEMHLKLTALESGGELTVIEDFIAPQSGPPLHVHARENEAYYVLEGEFEFTSGDDTVRGGPGTFVHSPRGIPHRYFNLGETPGRLLFSFTPGGIEAFFRELADRHATDPKTMTEIALRHGIQMLAPGR
jgi:quercetin dioxygenase-like cupin family protein/predicted small metal-binding protein